jgi:phosphoribosyl-AMP cyclohydrolase
LNAGERELQDQIEIRWDRAGLIPVIVQNDESGEVLMLEWMNAEALRLTQETGQTHFWSTKEGTIWQPGRESGSPQFVEALWIDCDGDALLLTVRLQGPACHNGQESCFYTEMPNILHPHTEDDLPWED